MRRRGAYELFAINAEARLAIWTTPRAASCAAKKLPCYSRSRGYRGTRCVIARQRPGQSCELHAGALAETDALPGIPGNLERRHRLAESEAPCGPRSQKLDHIGSPASRTKVTASLSLVETCRRINIPVRDLSWPRFPRVCRSSDTAPQILLLLPGFSALAIIPFVTITMA
jgi:hypothetical protein